MSALAIRTHWQHVVTLENPKNADGPSGVCAPRSMYIPRLNLHGLPSSFSVSFTLVRRISAGTGRTTTGQMLGAHSERTAGLSDLCFSWTCTYQLEFRSFVINEPSMSRTEAGVGGVQTPGDRLARCLVTRS